MTQATVEFASETVRNETLALDAVERFYAALNRLFAGEVEPMRQVWAEKPDVALLGPFGGRQMGSSAVLRLFERDATVKRGGQVTPRDLLVRIDNGLAYSVCIEQGEITTSTDKRIAVDLRATNILQREGDEWRVVYHHTDPLPQMQEAAGLKIEEFQTPKERPDPSVQKAVERFYEGVRSMFRGDVAPMAAIWAHTDDVSLACPGGNMQVGWEAVQAELERYGKLNIRADIQIKDLFVRVCGDLAYASYRESAEDMTIDGKPCPLKGRVTTIFRREDRQWRVIHHHSDRAPGLPESPSPPPK